MTDSMERRLRQMRSRILVRRWAYRQRHHARGVWPRLQRALSGAREAYAISLSEAQALIASGCRTEPAGLELEPPKAIVLVSAVEARRLSSARPLTVALSAELLGAEALALVPFVDEIREPSSGNG